MTAVGAESPQESAAAEAELGAWRVVVVALGAVHFGALGGGHFMEMRSVARLVSPLMIT
jgi:hypothetical protein